MEKFGKILLIFLNSDEQRKDLLLLRSASVKVLEVAKKADGVVCSTLWS